MVTKNSISMLNILNKVRLSFIKSEQNKWRSVHVLGNKNMSMKKQGFSTDDKLNRIVWMDLEMTGLDVQKDHILEVACIITDSDLNIVAEGPNLILHQPKQVLDNMNEWCIKHHSSSGLIEASLNSDLNCQKAEKLLLNFLMKHISQGTSPLAGNTVYMDRLFLSRFMPKLNEYLHYRIIDISTIKELCKRWNTNVSQQMHQKEYQHRALNDIKESIQELKYYKCNFFKI